MKKMLALCLGFLFLTPFDAFASFEEAMAALKEKDYNFASLELNRLVNEEGNPDAMYQLSLMHEQGLGMAKNQLEAMRFLRMAAQAGSDKAGVKLGAMYYSGRGDVEKNYPEAFKLFKMAADKGNFTAQYNVGLMLEQGVGGVADANPVQAFQYYLKSGNQGYYLAQNALGRMYVEGVGTTQNYTRGMGWYRLAADQGHVDSQMKLADLFANINIKGLPFNLAYAHVYYNIVAAYAGSPYREEAINARDLLIKKMQVKDIQTAQQIAQSWKKKNRTESLPPENFDNIATFDEEVARTEQQQTVKKDKKKPITVLTELEDILIETGVSRRTLYNAIQDNDFSKIISALQAQVEEGEQLSMVALGDLYLLGQGMEPDVAQALQLYKQAADQGNAIAAFRLAPLYCQGNGVAKDMNECYKWFVLSEKYADEHSRSIVSQTVKMLEQNLPAEQVAEMKKQMETYKTVTPESAGVINKFKEQFFGGGNDDAGKEEKKTDSAKKEESPKASAPKKEPKKEVKKQEEDDIMALPDL